LDRLARDSGRPRRELGHDALRLLSIHPFSGNVRELENVLTRAFVLGTGPRIGAADLGLVRAAPRRRATSTRREFQAEERGRILEALRTSRWNVSLVSRALGIPRNTLYRKLEKYGLNQQT
jgi:transcriptional regulator of acetoin/glycerol metabolism